MGKARIVGGGEAGLYQVEILYDRTRVDARIAFIEREIERLDAEIQSRQTELSDARQEMDAALAVLLQAMSDLSSASISLTQENWQMSADIQEARGML